MANNLILWENLLDTILSIPGCKINREEYLCSAFAGYGKTEELYNKSPLEIYSQDIIKKVAKDAIRLQTSKVTILSALSGIPGGFALLGTIPADLAQYYYHVIVIAQKLCYIYGFSSLTGENGDITEGIRNILTIFLAIMTGVQEVQGAITELVKEVLLKKVSAQILIKGTLSPIAKQAAKYVGASIARATVSRSMSKLVPLAGAVITGTLTYATYIRMAKRLMKELEEATQYRKALILVLEK